MKESERDLFRLQHILESCNKIISLTNSLDNFESFSNSWIIQDAMIRNFEIIGEAAKNISNRTTEEYPDIEWFKIKGLRNLIAHEYFGIRLETIWHTAIDDVPN